MSFPPPVFALLPDRETCSYLIAWICTLVNKNLLLSPVGDESRGTPLLPTGRGLVVRLVVKASARNRHVAVGVHRNPAVDMGVIMTRVTNVFGVAPRESDSKTLMVQPPLSSLP